MEKLGFLTVVWLVLLAEIPCIMRTVALQSQNQSIWSIVWGTMVGNVVGLILGIALAKLAIIFLPENLVGYVQHGTAASLILIGIYLLFFSG